MLEGGNKLSAKRESLFYFSVLILSIIMSLKYSHFTFSKTKVYSFKTLFKAIVFNLVIFLIASIWWFSFVSDGISQIMGIFHYIFAFVIFTSYTIILFLSKKNSDIKEL